MEAAKYVNLFEAQRHRYLFPQSYEYLTTLMGWQGQPYKIVWGSSKDVAGRWVLGVVRGL